jgi:Mg-chelatase subunit ChlD
MKKVTIALVASLLTGYACRDNTPTSSIGRTAEVPDRASREIDEALAASKQGEAREGLAAAILIDVSGSMDDRVTGDDGRRARKIDVARRAARDLIEQFAAYADERKGEPVLLGVYEFSRRNGRADARPIMPMAAPDRTHADAALSRLDPEGGTPIGQAMLTAKRELDATGLSRRHLLIVSDGENTDGFRPEDVAAAIGRRPETERPSLYFVAFDIDARRFTRLREAGSLVLSAGNARELNQTLDMLLKGNILVER